jgi:hypothetical protein
MARRFYRVGPSIWLEPWDDDTRSVAFYLLTSSHRTTEGLFRLPLEYARTDMRWTMKRFEGAFAKLLAAGFIEHDREAQVVLLVNALKWQAPANPNQIKAAVKAVAELPASPLLIRLLALAVTHCQPFAQALRERFPEQLGQPFAQLLGQPVANTPSPSPSLSPPDPPRGGRQRDRERFAAETAAWVAEHAPHPDSEPVEWDGAMGRLREAISDAKFEMYLGGLHPHGLLPDGRFALGAPKVSGGWAAGRFKDAIETAVGQKIMIVECGHVAAAA